MSEQTKLTCAICGAEIDATKWYAVLLDDNVHHLCFQASQSVGHNVRLLKSLVFSNKLNPITANEKLPNRRKRIAGNPRYVKVRRLKLLV